MKIKILGPGCANCRNLERNTREALAKLELDAEVEKIEDISAIMSYGIMSTPGLVVDEEVKAFGRVPSAREIALLLQAA